MTDGAGFPVAVEASGPSWAAMILWLPAISTALCGLCAAFKVRTKLAAWITVALLGGSFVLTASLFAGYEQPITIHVLDWFGIT